MLKLKIVPTNLLCFVVCFYSTSPSNMSPWTSFSNQFGCDHSNVACKFARQMQDLFSICTLPLIPLGTNFHETGAWSKSSLLSDITSSIDSSLTFTVSANVLSIWILQSDFMCFLCVEYTITLVKVFMIKCVFWICWIDFHCEFI